MMYNFNEICCVMDAQGFVKSMKKKIGKLECTEIKCDEIINEKIYEKVTTFYPREIGIISYTIKKVVLCDTYLQKSNMSAKDRITNNYLSNNLLGMSMGIYDLDVKHKMTDDAEQIIQSLYEMVKTDKKTIVAIKNHQLAPILERLNIPHVDMTKYGCPGINRLKKYYGRVRTCSFHEREIPDRNLLLCAEEKCVLLWKWIFHQIKLNKNDHL